MENSFCTISNGKLHVKSQEKGNVFIYVYVTVAKVICFLKAP